MNSLDFLREPSDARLRKEIANIRDSYSHPWDALAELLQNAVDAIYVHAHDYPGVRADGYHITIDLDSRTKALAVTDDGIGIAAANVVEALAPHSTLKDEQSSETIGQKGVGLTYTVFASNRYELESTTAASHVKGHVAGGALWVKGGGQLPNFEPEAWQETANEPVSTGTTVRLLDLQSAGPLDLFAQPTGVIELWLRTRTAVGCTKAKFAKLGVVAAPKVTVKFRHTPLNDPPNETQVPFEYLWPDSLVKGVVDYDDVIAKWTNSMTDAQKRSVLKGKAIVNMGLLRGVRFHVFFAPRRELWDEISKDHGYVRTNDAGEDEFLYQGGIFTSSRGMPTGVDALEPPRGYSSGYWPNFRMLLEHDGITFDLGRKSLGNHQALFSRVAKELFDKIWPYYKYTSTNPAIFPAGVAQLEKKATFDELRKRPDLPVKDLHFIKHPFDQEAAVVAIFHDLVGMGHLRGYRALGMGYRETYDSWGTYRIDAATAGDNYKPYHGKELDVVIEFKNVAEDFVRDVEQDAKQWELVDLVVCWDFDALKVTQRGFVVDPIPVEDIQFHGSNYRLTPPGGGAGAAAKPVLALRQFLDAMAAN